MSGSRGRCPQLLPLGPACGAARRPAPCRPARTRARCGWPSGKRRLQVGERGGPPRSCVRPEGARRRGELRAGPLSAFFIFPWKRQKGGKTLPEAALPVESFSASRFRHALPLMTAPEPLLRSAVRSVRLLAANRGCVGAALGTELPSFGNVSSFKWRFLSEIKIWSAASSRLFSVYYAKMLRLKNFQISPRMSSVSGCLYIIQI